MKYVEFYNFVILLYFDINILEVRYYNVYDFVVDLIEILCM